MPRDWSSIIHAAASKPAPHGCKGYHGNEQPRHHECVPKWATPDVRQRVEVTAHGRNRENDVELDRVGEKPDHDLEVLVLEEEVLFDQLHGEPGGEGASEEHKAPVVFPPGAVRPLRRHDERRDTDTDH